MSETFVFANNHFAGHGPATIRELATLLAAGGRIPGLPAPTPAPGVGPGDGDHREARP